MSQAKLRGVRMSPRKVSEVAALIRGRTVSDALTILENTPRRAAQVVKEAVVSAKANAEHNHNFKPDSLFISQISVNRGTPLRRFRAAARGRALRYQHQMAHIYVTVDGDKREVKKPTSKPDAEKSEEKK